MKQFNARTNPPVPSKKNQKKNKKKKQQNNRTMNGNKRKGLDQQQFLPVKAKDNF